jgi:gliding motility-associated-like protein
VDTVVVLPCCEPGPVNAVVDAIACAGADDGRITVTPLAPNGPFTYAWSTSPPQATPTVDELGPGTYSVVITDGDGCDTTLTFTLEEPAALTVEATGELELCPGQAGTFTAAAQGGTGTTAISWSTGAQGASVQQAFAASTALVATATDANGCTATDTLAVSVLPPSAGPFVPNVFSPNGDGMNDVFTVLAPYLDDRGLLRVFNRWGLEVFSTNDLVRGWNGRVKGEPAPDGMYVYVIITTDPCRGGEQVELRGHVTLLR